MKKSLPEILKSAMFFAVLIAWCATGRAQSTAFWTNLSGGEWNTAANWNVDLLGVNLVPASGTNADIGSQGVATVSYDLPMASPNFGILTIGAGSALSVNTNGFNIDAGGSGSPFINLSGPLNVGANGFLAASNGAGVNIASGGSLNVMGNVFLMTATAAATNTPLAIASGTRLNITNGNVVIANSGRIAMPTDSAVHIQGGTFIMTNNAESSGITMGVNGNVNGAAFTNIGGTVILDQRLEVRGRGSRFIMQGGTLKLSQIGTNGIFEPNNDTDRQFLINGGTADLGNFVVTRTLTSPGAGLVVSNGVVTANSLRVGITAAGAFATFYGGVFSNSGAFYILDRTNGAVTGDRRIRFLVRGGSVISTAAEGIIVANAGNLVTNLVGAGTIGAILDMNAGSITAEKLTLIRDNTISNAHATFLLSGGTLTLGSGGLVANVGPTNTTYTITMSGGTIAAKASHSINANMALSGTTPTFQAADAGGTPFNITHSGIISGSGILNKTGGGILSLTTNDTRSGSTFINNGTLALGASGSISNSPLIHVSSGATFDVSAVSGGFVLNASRTLAGSGTVSGTVSGASSATINPGSNTVTGTLTFGNNLVEAGGVINHLDLANSPLSPNNDLIVVSGDLNVSGANTIEVSGSLAAASAYRLIQYGGNFNGSLGNFTLVGGTGTFSNSVVNKTIYLVTQSGIRGPTNIVWAGSATANDWDLANHTNWLNNGVLDFFVSDDAVRFDATGATHPSVNIVGNVSSSSTMVDGASYTFGGNGNVSGTGSLTKSNAGTLTILTTNSYSGATIIAGGILEASTIRNNQTPSAIGAANTDPINLQFNGGALRYLGASTSTDRGATANSAAVVDVSSGAATLTVNGNVVGNGGLTKVGPGGLTLAGVNSYAGVTTVSNGVLQINGATTAALGTNAVNLAGGTLFLNVSGQPTYSFILNLLAASAMNVAANNTIFLATAWSGSDVLNVNVNSGGFFTINSDINPAFSSTLAFGTSAGIARFNAGGNGTSAQQCNGSSNVVFDLGSASLALINRNGGGVSFGTYFLGGLAGGANTQLRGSENSGSTCTYEIGARNLNTTFGGSIRNGHAGTGSPQASAAVSINKVGTGTLTLSGTNLHSGTTTVSSGALAISGFGSIANSTTILVPTNTVLDVASRVDGTLTLAANQTLKGSGTIRGSVTVGNTAILTVGDLDPYPDLMVITNALVLNSGSTLNMDLDFFQLLGARTNDTILGLSSVTYGGTLNLTITSVDVTSVFKLFSAGSYGGAFSSISPPTPPGLPAQYAWDTSQLTVDGTLRIGFARPIITSIQATGADLTFDGINGIPGAEYHVLSSTNVALPITQWTSIATNTFGSSTFQFTLVNAINPAIPQLFYLLQVIVP